MSEPISARRFHRSEGVEEWRVLGDGACSCFRTGSLAEAARFVATIGALPGNEADIATTMDRD